MNLADYIELNELTYEEFAERVSMLAKKTVRRSDVHRWAKGVRVPSRKILPFLVKASKGHVQPSDFYPGWESPKIERLSA